MTDSEATSVFHRFRERFERGETVVFEDLLAVHPGLASELRRLHADWILSSDAAVSLPASGSDERNDELGWSRLLSRLAVRGAQTDRYERRGEIGRGGMGVVREVFDRDLLRTLAMKTMRVDRELGSGSTPRTDPALSRLLEEAQVTAQLDHPGVVPVHEVGIDDEGQVFFTMKLVAGEDLGEVFTASRARLADRTLAQAIGILARVTDAVRYAHDKKVIHRDLKPSNVRVGRYGEVYVMDWGLARILNDDSASGALARSIRARSHRRDAIENESPIHTMEGDVLGTPSYMSPEQALGAGSHVGIATDIYALGAMLYELLAGSKPYTVDGVSPSPREILSRILVGPPLPIATAAPDAPPELLAICEKAMHRDVRLRYASMGELGDDLRAYLEGRVVRAHATGALVELRKWIVRNRWVATAAAIALFTVVGGASLVAWRESVSRAAIARERDEVLRLADAERAVALRERADSLWPAWPSVIGEIEDWRNDARDLVSRLADHHRDLADLRLRALPRTPEDERLDRESSPEYEELLELRGFLAAARHEIYRRGALEASGRENRVSEPFEQQREKIAELERRVLASEVTAAAPTRRLWRFETAEDTWRHTMLTTLVESIESLDRPDPPDVADYRDTVSIVALERRLELARAERREYEARRDAWQAAIGAIAEPSRCPHYHGLRIEQQHGLAPLAIDPVSGLFEFFVPCSGDEPRRDVDGRWVIAPETAIVLVLVPGGNTFLGSQPIDAAEPNYDREGPTDEGPVIAVRLDPFFISKYEVTQAQWKRLFGVNPAWNNPVRFPRDVGWTNPVEYVSWTDCDRSLRKIGLELPTEAQWEYAARAGTTTKWWTGAEASSQEGAGNLLDRSYVLEIRTSEVPEPFDDGYDLHAPVGSFRSNAFGLHDVSGNVWEWCRDPWGFYTDPLKDGTGERIGRYSTTRVNRGGSYQNRAITTASAYREHNDPGTRVPALGVRPVRRLLSKDTTPHGQR